MAKEPSKLLSEEELVDKLFDLFVKIHPSHIDELLDLFIRTDPSIIVVAVGTAKMQVNNFRQHILSSLKDDLMATLTPEERQRWLGETGHKCRHCGKTVVKNYCRQCDEFYNICDCSPKPDSRDNHIGHRTY